MKTLIALLYTVLLLLPSWVWAEGLPGVSGPYPQFLNSAVVTGDTAVISTPAFLQCIMISQNDAAPTAGSIIIYDNTAESGTVVFNWTLTTAVFTPFQICPQRAMTTGIYVGFTTTADVNVSVSYRK